MKKWEKKGVISPKITYDEAENIFRHEKIRKGLLKDRYFFFESYYKEILGKDMLLWEKDVFLFPKKITNGFSELIFHLWTYLYESLNSNVFLLYA